MRKFLAIVIASFVVFASPAYAWGDREQGAAVGLFLGWVLGQHQTQQQQPAQPPAPVIVMPPAQQPAQPAPIIITPPSANSGRTCLQHPIYDAQGRVIAYQISCH